MDLYIKTGGAPKACHENLRPGGRQGKWPLWEWRKTKKIRNGKKPDKKIHPNVKKKRGYKMNLEEGEIDWARKL